MRNVPGTTQGLIACDANRMEKKGWVTARTGTLSFSSRHAAHTTTPSRFSSSHRIPLITPFLFCGTQSMQMRCTERTRLRAFFLNITTLAVVEISQPSTIVTFFLSKHFGRFAVPPPEETSPPTPYPIYFFALFLPSVLVRPPPKQTTLHEQCRTPPFSYLTDGERFFSFFFPILPRPPGDAYVWLIILSRAPRLSSMLLLPLV